MKPLITLATLIISLMLITGCATTKNDGLVKSPCACDFKPLTPETHG